MLRAYQLARELGEIHRHPPGIWGHEDAGVGPAINSSTVAALVTRGLLYYSLWKATESGNMFPIAAAPRSCLTVDDDAQGGATLSETFALRLPIDGNPTADA